MEAAVANLTEPGDKFALLTNGFFGDRIGDMAARHGGQPDTAAARGARL